MTNHITDQSLKKYFLKVTPRTTIGAFVKSHVNAPEPCRYVLKYNKH